MSFGLPTTPLARFGEVEILGAASSVTFALIEIPIYFAFRPTLMLKCPRTNVTFWLETHS